MERQSSPVELVETTPRYVVIEQDHLRQIRWTDDSASFVSAMRLDQPDLLSAAYLFSMIQPIILIDDPRDAILLGLGGGQMAKFIHRHLPDTRLVAMEIDPTMVELAHSHFGLPADDERLQVVVGDGARLIADYPDKCDLILSDASGVCNGLIEALHTEAFYLDCHRILRSGGIMTVNIFRPPVEWGKGHITMLRRIFAEVYLTSLSADQLVITLCKDPLGADWDARTRRAAAFDPAAGLGLPEFVAQFPRLPAPSTESAG